MHGDRALIASDQPELPAHAEDLRSDLGLDIVLETMADGDSRILEVAERALLTGLTDAGEVRYRQRVLSDALEHPELVRELYALARETLERRRREQFGYFARSPGVIVSAAVRAMDVLTEMLARLRAVTDPRISDVESEGLARLFRELSSELDDSYLDRVTQMLKELRFRRGVTIGAGLGPGNTGIGHTLHPTVRRTWREQLHLGGRRALTYQLPSRDEAGGRALREMRDRGFDRASVAVAKSVDEVTGFFRSLADELAFFVGCLNLHERLDEIGASSSLPRPLDPPRRCLVFSGLYDIGLCLGSGEPPVANDADADDKRLLIVTGANEGGKSTFLRSLGLAQLLMQAGMFVPAERFEADLRAKVFTHFKREEDASMEHGKLDEELVRMSAICESIEAGDMLLCNESFASTNEVEGSEIAWQITQALVDCGVKVVHVTHMYEFARRELERDGKRTLFLRAERQSDGNRTFKLKQAPPEPTSYGADLYERIFGERPSAGTIEGGFEPAPSFVGPRFQDEERR